MVVIIFNILLLLTLFINTIKLQQKSERLVYLQHNEAPLRHYTTRPASTSGNTAQIKSVFPKPSSRRTPNGLGLSRYDNLERQDPFRCNPLLPKLPSQRTPSKLGIRSYDSPKASRLPRNDDICLAAYLEQARCRLFRHLSVRSFPPKR